ncbi:MULTISPECIES: DUF805 domain-containing protein [unclassified Sphingopyxis]|uniref:DUF805 domain-containing protein n=1 Tax=unclassified Sphingopyxis TaxID=2614943 RepID=UPI0007369D5B|nr:MULTISPECIES: DUF805 domain-containing protein [unclassified Sphingopyxis]KTE28614.1 hypothetical protein ATE62_21550 [Sphingopyxis sp. HIX]KTE71830.1 hypothetical protein ATE72_22580 [Sphingopyxis sp. HXXIV]
MADMSMARIAKRGVVGTFDPRGRDDRLQFWLYFAMVFAPMIFVQFVAQMVLTFPTIDPSLTAEANTAAIDRKMFGAIGTSGYLNLACHLIAAVLLLSATARRLHDRGRAGWWALIFPSAVLAAGLDQARRMDVMAGHMARMTTEMRKAPPEPIEMLSFPAELQAAMPGPSWPAIVAGIAMLWLAIELLRAGTPGDNRFGPQP